MESPHSDHEEPDVITGIESSADIAIKDIRILFPLISKFLNFMENIGIFDISRYDKSKAKIGIV